MDPKREVVSFLQGAPSPDVTFPGRMTEVSSSFVNSDSENSLRRASAPRSGDSLPPGPPAPGGVTLSPEVRPGLPTVLPRWRGAVTSNSELPLIWSRFDPCSLCHHTRGRTAAATLPPSAPRAPCAWEEAGAAP